MLIHVIADHPDRFARLRALLPSQVVVSFSLLGDIGKVAAAAQALVVAVDIRAIANITALKLEMPGLGGVAKRIFLIDEFSYHLSAQAYALGATCVLDRNVSDRQLRALLVDRDVPNQVPAPEQRDTEQAASVAASALAAMFKAAAAGNGIDVVGIRNAADRVTEAVMDHGLTSWLTSVRRHHEATYQHCLLVTGIAVEFAISLGMSSKDIQRLAIAASYHDIGKARIPLALLDKPGKLDADERAVMQRHAPFGYDALKDTAGIDGEVLEAVRHHHEYLDGSGYPDGLSAGRISDVVRLLTIADIFSALIEDRRYKPTMPRDKAFDILETMHGKLEVPLVRAFRPVALGQPRPTRAKAPNQTAARAR